MFARKFFLLIGFGVTAVLTGCISTMPQRGGYYPPQNMGYGVPRQPQCWTENRVVARRPIPPQYDRYGRQIAGPSVQEVWAPTRVCR